MLPDFYVALEAKIRARMVPAESGCVLWHGAASGKGYGRIKFAGKLYSPHRVMLELKLGRCMLPAEDTRHTCDVPRCVSQAHLIHGSRADNVRDAIDRGRARVPPGNVAGRPLSAARCLACGRLMRDVCKHYAPKR